MQTVELLSSLIALLDAGLQAEGAIETLLKPTIDKMAAENRTAMTAEEKAQFRAQTAAARAYALASKPGDPLT